MPFSSVLLEQAVDLPDGDLQKAGRLAVGHAPPCDTSEDLCSALLLIAQGDSSHAQHGNALKKSLSS